AARTSSLASFAFCSTKDPQPRDLGSVNGGFETDDRQTTQIGGLLERANMSSCKRRVARHVCLFDIGETCFDLPRLSGVDAGYSAGDQREQADDAEDLQTDSVSHATVPTSSQPIVSSHHERSPGAGGGQPISPRALRH